MHPPMDLRMRYRVRFADGMTYFLEAATAEEAGAIAAGERLAEEAAGTPSDDSPRAMAAVERVEPLDDLDQSRQAWLDEDYRSFLAEKRDRDGDFFPPWRVYPYSRFSMGWRMGSGEWYMWGWGRWYHELPADHRRRYRWKYWPPLSWWDFYIPQDRPWVVWTIVTAHFLLWFAFVPFGISMLLRSLARIIHAFPAE